MLRVFCSIVTMYEMPYLNFGLFLVVVCGFSMCFVNGLGSNKLVMYL